MSILTLKQASHDDLLQAMRMIDHIVSMHDMYKHEVPAEILHKLYMMVEELDDIIVDHFSEDSEDESDK